MWLELGVRVACEGQKVGELKDVLIDPGANLLTHVAVDAKDGVKRLVPASAVESHGPGTHEAFLTCTIEELEALEPVRRFAYVQFGDEPEMDDGADVGVEDVVTPPAFTTDQFGTYGDPYQTVGIAYDRIPKGEVELSHSSEVLAAGDERVGRVAGVVVEDDRQLTHVVVEYGHLWGLREVAVPLASVERLATGSVVLRLSRPQVTALPAVRVRRLPSFL